MPGLRGDQVALYTKDMYKAEREAFTEIPTKYDQVYKVKTGLKGAGDKSTQILGAGDLTRHLTEGQDIVFKTPTQGWEYLVRYWTYSDGIALSKEAVEDTVKLGNLLKELANSWGVSERVEKETFAAVPFNRGGDLLGEWIFDGSHTNNADSSLNMLYDSKPLFALNNATYMHTTKGGGQYYNSVASLSLTPANFETVYNLHTATNNRSERDRVVSNPCDTLMTKPGSDRFIAERILDTSKGMPGGQLNDVNPYYKIVSTIDWDYLSDTSPVWYLGKRQSEKFQFHERQRPEIRFFRDEKNLGYKASINLRIGVLIKDWKIWSRGGGTAA